MDELAAAAAVVAMAVDSENPEDAELETTVGTVGAAVGDEAASQICTPCDITDLAHDLPVMCDVIPSV